MVEVVGRDIFSGTLYGILFLLQPPTSIRSVQTPDNGCERQARTESWLTSCGCGAFDVGGECGNGRG
jgi:hypothetical protein